VPFFLVLWVDRRDYFLVHIKHKYNTGWLTASKNDRIRRLRLRQFNGRNNSAEPRLWLFQTNGIVALPPNTQNLFLHYIRITKSHIKTIPPFLYPNTNTSVPYTLIKCAHQNLRRTNVTIPAKYSAKKLRPGKRPGLAPWRQMIYIRLILSWKRCASFT